MGLALVSTPAWAYLECQSGFNKYGVYAPCLKRKRVEARRPNRPPVENPHAGKPERIQKHIDGSVSVWIAGASESQEGKPDGHDA